MKVILNSDVPSLGEEGDIRVVAPGFARNYLLPKGLVMEHNDRNIALIEGRRAEIDKRKADKRKQASTLKEQIEAEPMKITMTAGGNGKLFGSVTATTVHERLAAIGINVERKKIDIAEKNLKAVGNYKVRIRLYGDEEAILTVSIEASNAREIEKERAAMEKAERESAAAQQPSEEEIPEDQERLEDEDDEMLDPEIMAMKAAQEEADAREQAAAAPAAEETDEDPEDE